MIWRKKVNDALSVRTMSIERWDPFHEAISLRDAMNSLFQYSFVRPGGMAAQSGLTALPLDVSETENEFVVKASLPGIKPDDVQITVHGDTLTIRGESKVEEEKKDEHWHIRERRSGVFQRSLSLSAPVESRGGSFGLGEPVADGKGEAGKNVTAVEILILELRSATHELWDGRVILGSERGCDIEGNLPPRSGPMGDG